MKSLAKYLSAGVTAVALCLPVGIAEKYLPASKASADVIQFGNQSTPGSGIGGTSNVLDANYAAGSGVSPGYDPSDLDLDTSINPNDQFFVTYFPMVDGSGADRAIQHNFAPFPNVGDSYTARLGFEDRMGITTYAQNKIKFDTFTLNNPNGVTDYRYELSVDTDFDNVRDYTETGLVSEIMATSEKTTGTWGQWIPSGYDWRNGNFYGSLTLTALGDSQPTYHEMSVGFNPTKEGVPLGASDPLIIRYGEAGATSTRNDATDVSTGWGDDKFSATSEGQYGTLSRSEPFGPGPEMLIIDSRVEDDTSHILVENWTNRVYDKPGEWIPGQTWNDSSDLEIAVKDNDSYFDNFLVSQMDTASFNPRSGLGTPLTVQEIDMLDGIDDGVGSYNFGRVGWTGALSEGELDFWAGPHSSFDISPTGLVWDNVTNTYVIENGTYAIVHPKTPEPSTWAMLGGGAILAGAYGWRRRKNRKSLVQLASENSWDKSPENPMNISV